MTEEGRIFSGMLFASEEPELIEKKRKAHRLSQEFSALFEEDDDARVSIGDYCNFGPNVTIVTPLHPMLPRERRGVVCTDGVERFLCNAKPVTIGSDCWFGTNVVICPGLTIGDGCVIGAGSVVTRDIPPNAFAAGVPARIIREITEKDSNNLFLARGKNDYPCYLSVYSS